MVEQIGRYEIRRELGRGGMASVYLAYDPRIQRQVAIKVLPRQFTHDPRYLDRFRQEARMIAALEHPAIVPIHDFGEENDAPYLVMRYMAGGSLRDRLSGAPLTIEEIVPALERLAQALDHAHELGIVHRDLKPSNILFDYEGRPYLADFGIARMAEASHTMTIVGTPAYMSPEQVESEVKLDGRSDIYALGVILYELLTGRQPYTAETPTGQMLMHITKPIPNILEANPDLPLGIQQVIEKAMAKDREERYQSAAELATAVNSLLDAESASGENGAAVDTVPLTAGVVPDEPKDAAVSQPSEEAVPIVGTAASTDGSGAAPPMDIDSIGYQLPGWVWWVGALVLLVIVVLGVRSIFGGSDQPEATKTPEAPAAAIVEAIATATLAPSPTHEPPTLTATSRPSKMPPPTEIFTEEPGPTAELTETPTAEPSPTPTAGPKIPPLVAELGDT
jgi:hypothetical protein